MEDIGERIGVRGPSLYRHVSSKHEILVDIMVTALRDALAVTHSAISQAVDPSAQFRLAVEAHVRYVATHRYETIVTTRELDNLEQPDRKLIFDLRAEYERDFLDLIERSEESGAFELDSPHLVMHAVLVMGIGVCMWFRPDGRLSVDEVASLYGAMALRLVGARSSVLS